MSKVEISKITDNFYGNCIKIENGMIELLVTVDYGPRVIHCSACGKENIFYVDEEKRSLGEVQPCYGGDIIRLYGGHRLWISPEEMPRCYYPDNFPVEYKEIENGVVFKAPVEKINYIQKIIQITLDTDSPTVFVENTIKNCGVWDVELAPWSITQMAKGGIEVMPQPKRETGYLHNRNISLWPYSIMNDERVYWGKDFITLRQDENASVPFKLGYNNEEGWAAYFNRGQVFFKFFDPNINGEFYPDNGCCYETYTNNLMLEAECLGQLITFPPNEEISLSEEWEIYVTDDVPEARNEENIKSIISKYINFE